MTLMMVGNFLSKQLQTRGVCEDLAVRLAERGWRVLTVSSQLNRVLRLADIVRSLYLNRHRFDIAHVDVYSGRGFLLAQIACRILRSLRKPYVLALHGGNLPNFASRHPDRVRRLLQSADAVTVPSRYLLQMFCSFRDDLEVIANPIDVSNYPFKLRERVEPRLVWLRAFNAIYNPSMAPRVVALLQREFPDTRLVMAGPDKGDGSLDEAMGVASRLDLSAMVKFAGAINKAEVPAYLRQGDVFLNTTRIDNTPVSVLEAMACGMPIVSTNVGGIPYLLEHEKTALLVPDGDVAGMASAVKRILTDSALARRLSSCAYDHVQSFDWQHVLPKWEALFNRLG